MALNPSSTYPSQVDTSDPTGWPYGRARNESVAGARNGTPLEEAWVSDLWGFQQALLESANITPSGNPDRSGSNGTQSQYLRAIRQLNFDLVLPLPAATREGSHFTFEPSTGWTQTTAGGAFAGSFLYFPIGPLPYSILKRKTYLREISLRVQPASHGALPSSMPGFWLFHATSAGLENVNNEAFLDASGTVGAYNSSHSIVGALSTPLEIVFSSSLYVGIFGEYGTNAMTGLRILGLACVLSDSPDSP